MHVEFETIKNELVSFNRPALKKLSLGHTKQTKPMKSEVNNRTSDIWGLFLPLADIWIAPPQIKVIYTCYALLLYLCILPSPNFQHFIKMGALRYLPLQRDWRTAPIRNENDHLAPRVLSESRHRKSNHIKLRLIALLPTVVLITFLIIATRVIPNKWWNHHDFGPDFLRLAMISTFYDEPANCNPTLLSRQSWLAPDMAFGNFTITDARAIDVSWNLVVGRGLQAIMAVVTYYVACTALLRIAEMVPVSYELFATTTLSSFSMSALVPLARAVIRTQGWRAKIAISFLLVSAALILAVPTLADLTTGYLQQSRMYIQYANGTMLAKNPFPACMINQPDPDSANWEICDAPVYYVRNNLTFCNCTTYASMLFTCVPQTGYQWGFSSVWVLTTTVALIVWSMAMYILWLDASMYSPLQRSGRRLGKWTAVVDLAGAMKNELGANMSTYSDSELRNCVNDAAPVCYTTSHDYEIGADRVVLSSTEANKLGQAFSVDKS
jgi:hypothetical protein